MKAKLASLVAAPLLAFSSMSFAAEPVELSMNQMDEVTAGFWSRIQVGNFATQLNSANVGIGAQVGVVNFNLIGVGQANLLEQNFQVLGVGFNNN